MGARGVNKLNAYFNLGEQNTGIAIQKAENDSYDVKAVYRQVRKTEFPQSDVVKREGWVSENEVNALVDILLDECSGWYHHYLPPKAEQVEQRGSVQKWWGLRIEYSDGMVMRWEGIETAPWDINDIYQPLREFGMPSLVLDWPNSFAQQFDNRRPRKGLEMIDYYERLLGEVRGLGAEDEPSEDVLLVAREFVDDLGHWLKEDRSSLSQQTAFRIWHIEPTLESLQEKDVHEASRIQIHVLYEALTCTEEPEACVLALFDSGVLASWRQRLEELPKQGYWDIQNCEREAYEAEGAAVDQEVRKFIEAGEVFTARDVAERIGCSGQRTSARIRAFVNRGELKVVQTTAPRRYQAA